MGGMPKPPRPWIVGTNNPLEKHEENFWSISGVIPENGIHRRMSMVRLSDGQIVFLDAVPMDDGTMAQIKAWGRPSILWVSHGGHRRDVHAFREKLGLRVLTPKTAEAKVRAMVQVDGNLDALP